MHCEENFDDKKAPQWPLNESCKTHLRSPVYPIKNQYRKISTKARSDCPKILDTMKTTLNVIDSTWWIYQTSVSGSTDTSLPEFPCARAMAQELVPYRAPIWGHTNKTRCVLEKIILVHDQWRPGHVSTPHLFRWLMFVVLHTNWWHYQAWLGDCTKNAHNANILELNESKVCK